jgi:hypothetical protein
LKNPANAAGKDEERRSFYPIDSDERSDPRAANDHSSKRVIPDKFILVMKHAEDVGVEDTPDGKRVAIYFEKSTY